MKPKSTFKISLNTTANKEASVPNFNQIEGAQNTNNTPHEEIRKTDAGNDASIMELQTDAKTEYPIHFLNS